MRINKKKFCVRIFILISITGLLIYGRFLATHEEERENLLNYYKDLISSFKGEASTYIVTEKFFSVPTDKSQKNTVIGKNNGVTVVNTNGIKEYNHSSTAVWEEDLFIASPIVESSDEWIIIGEDKGKKVVVYNGKNEVYNLEIDGEIQKVFINSNGYAGVIFAKVGYKNAFSFINSKGEVLYTKYFANTTLIDVDISEDGKKIIMLEADVNGAVVNSAITILDNKANTVNSSIKKNSLLVEAHFFGNNAIVLGDDVIVSIDDHYNETIIDELDTESTIGILLEDNKIIKLYRDINELFANKTIVEINDGLGEMIGRGEVIGTAHSLASQGNTIAVVLADRIDFLTKKGHYISSIFISSDYKDVQLFNKGAYACVQTNDEIAIYKIR